MRSRVSSIVIIGAVAALAVSSCSSSAKSGTANKTIANLSPASAAATAMDNITSASSLSVAISFPVTASQFQQLAPTAPAKAAGLITSGSIFFTIGTTNGEGVGTAIAKSDPNIDVEFGVNVAGVTPIDFRVVHQNLYLQIQAQAIATATGTDIGPSSKLGQELSSANNFVPGISDLAQGKWVELSQSQLKDLYSSLKQAQSSSSATTLPTAQIQGAVKQVESKVFAALQAASTYTNLGTSGGRTEYSDTVNVQTLLNAIIPEVQNAFNAIPGYGSKIGSGLQNAQGKLPANKTAVFDLYTANNKLVEVDYDVDQYAHKYSFPTPIRLTFTSPGPPSAPSGATMLDLSKIKSLLGGLGGNNS